MDAHSVTVSLPAGKRICHVRFGNGPLLTPEELARELGPRWEVRIGGKRVEPAPPALSPGEASAALLLAMRAV